MDNELKAEGNSLNYTFRMHDPRVGRFFAVDPLTKKFPWYSPYQFSGNRVIDMGELEGMEPTSKGKEGQYAVAPLKGTSDYYGWTTKNGDWVQGSSTMYENGSISNTSSHNDDNKNHYPSVKVAPLVSNQAQIIMPTPTIPINNNDLSARYTEFAAAFVSGTKLESDAAESEALSLIKNFNTGIGKSLSFGTNSNMARILSEDVEFGRFATTFEQSVMQYYKAKGSLEGFNGNGTLVRLGKPYIKDTWFMHTVLGGTQQWNAQIRSISAADIQVRYTVYDRFGAGTDDAQSKLPGLPSMYWLQHNSYKYYPNTSSNYTPFTWNINVLRK